MKEESVITAREGTEPWITKYKETGNNTFVRRGPTLSGVKGVIEDTTYLMNITEKILLVLKFELTQKYSASKSQHC